MFEPSHLSDLADTPKATKGKADAAKEQKLSAGLDKASKAVAATAAASSVVAPPWSLVVSAAAAATALGLQVASKVSGHNAQILAGDERAIAPYVKRAAKMTAAQRKKEASKLLKQLKAWNKKPHKDTDRAWKVRANLLKMKLAALYAAQHHGHHKPKTPLVPGGPTPVQVEAAGGRLHAPGPAGVSWWVWGGGALGLAVVGGVLVARR